MNHPESLLRFIEQPLSRLVGPRNRWLVDQPVAVGQDPEGSPLERVQGA